MVETMPRPSFYSGPTPRLQRLTRTRPRYAPATKPAPEALPALVMHFASWVTWLEGVIPRASDRMGGLPSAIVSASWRERQNWPFRGSEYRSYPVPFDHCFSPLLGPAWAPKQRFRHRLPRHSPASPCGPFMVELFTAAGFSRSPRTWSKVRLRLSPAEGSPRRHTLNEPAFADRPEPHGRICGLTAAHRLCDMTAPMPTHRGLSASPPFRVPATGRRHGSKTLSDRTLRLNAGKQSQRVYFSEPPSSTDKPVSGHPALLAQHAMAG